MSIDARNILVILLGWFQHTYFLVIITSFITSYVILSLYLITLPALSLPLATSLLPSPGLAYPSHRELSLT